VYTHNRIILSLKKQGNAPIWSHMDKLRKHYVRENKPGTQTNTVLSHFYEESKNVELSQAESRLVVTGDSKE
jgi:hypothetical protein